MPTYDLLIKGGTLIDPAQKLHAKRDKTKEKLDELGED